MRPPLVLGIETSCDDTACAVVDGLGCVLASVVSSQLAVHRPYGGVVPELASREQLANWPAVYEETLARAGVALACCSAIWRSQISGWPPTAAPRRRFPSASWRWWFPAGTPASTA